MESNSPSTIVELLIKIDDSERPPVRCVWGEALVSDKQVDWAARALQRFFAILEQDDILKIAAEVGLFHCLSYNEDCTGFNFDGTDLQLIALAAAIHSVGQIKEIAE